MKPLPTEPSHLLGSALSRVDGPAKVCGLARYAADFAAPGVVHATLVTSTVAQGRIEAIDDSEALAHPGVIGVMTHLNAPRLPEGGRAGVKPPAARTLSLLQHDLVHHDRQPIAVVLGETLESSRHAASLVRVRYAVPSPTLDFEAGFASAHPPKDVQGQAPDSSRGDLAGGWQAAAHRVDARYATPTEHHNPMEPHATLARWEDGTLTLVDSTQSVHGLRQMVAQRLGLAAEQVRVISPYVGGAFGSKGSGWSHVVLAAMAARQLGRPVRLVLERPQLFGPVGNRPQTAQQVRLGADGNGQLTAVEHHVHAETSLMEDWIEPSALVTRMLYASPALATSHRLVPLSIGVPTFQRAPGEATGSFALEVAMDELAVAAGIDPIELRLRNHADEDAGQGKPFSSKSLKQCYAEGAQRFGWSRRNQQPGTLREGDERIGWGMATATYPSKRMPAQAAATLQRDGRVRITCGTHDLGTGTYTMLTQVAGDVLGLPAERIEVCLGDTHWPMAPVSGGSMTTASAGSAVHAACSALRDRLVQHAVADPASPLHGVEPEQIHLDGGQVVERAGSRHEPLAELARRLPDDALHVQAEARPDPDSEHFSKHAFGAVFTEVRIDEALGIIRVPRIVAAYAVGRLLNAKTGRSQLMGGIVWGLSMALHEHSLRDGRYGRIANANLGEYHVPVNADVPDIELVVIPEEDPHLNPMGAKGVGEIGITGVAAAVANAVWHATGRRIRSLPIALDQLL